ncbi:MAG: rod-binding protein [Rhodospirillales bacterium]|nr:rod-binding protein [Rhodospirillales bacterium]
MNDLMTPDTQIALMTASQADIGKAVQKTKGTNDIKNLEKIEEAAQEFEAVFLSEMLKPMFEGTMEPDPMFGGGKGEEIFKGMMLQEYGKMLADKGGVGIAEHVKAELIRIQETAQK